MDLATLVHRPALTCHVGTGLRAVAGLMRDSNTGSVVVLDGSGRLCGIVTDRDLVVRGLTGTDDDLRRRVEDVMTDDPTYVYEDEDLVAAAARMVEHSCRRLPVLDRDGTVIGVLALDDLLLAFTRLLDMLAGVVGSVDVWSSVEDRERSQAKSRPPAPSRTRPGP